MSGRSVCTTSRTGCSPALFTPRLNCTQSLPAVCIQQPFQKNRSFRHPSFMQHTVLTLATAISTPHRRSSPLFPQRSAQPLRRLCVRALRLLPKFSAARALRRLRYTFAARGNSSLHGLHAQNFRLHGLKWHHAAVTRHLRALHTRLLTDNENEDDVIFAKTAFEFVLHHVWGTYNALEKDVLFPWLLTARHADGRAPSARLGRIVRGFERERERVVNDARKVERGLKRIVEIKESFGVSGGGRDSAQVKRVPTVAAVDFGRGVKRRRRKRKRKGTESGMMRMSAREEREEVRHVAHELRKLIQDAETLHRAEQAVLFPIIAEKFSEKEQKKIIFRLIECMDGSDAKRQLVDYEQTLLQMRDKFMLRKFQEQVPTPVRLWLPVWKARLYDTSPLAELHRKNVDNSHVKRIKW